MADKTITIHDYPSSAHVEQLYHDNGDKTYAQVVHVEGDSVGLTNTELRADPVPAIDLRSDLKLGAKSLALTLSSGAGSVPIPDTCSIVGVKPVVSTTMRVGLEAPEADGSDTGAADAAELKKGVPVDATVWTWFNLGLGTSRVLYVIGGASDVVEVVVM